MNETITTTTVLKGKGKKARKQSTNKTNQVVTTKRETTRKARPGTRNGKRKQKMASAPASFGRALADPWNNDGCVPDGASGSGCWFAKYTFSLSTGPTTGTSCGFIASTDPMNSLAIDTGSSSATSTYPSTGSTYYSPSGTSSSQLFKSWRCAGMSMKVVYTGSTMNDQGVIVGAQFPTGLQPNNFNAGTIATTTPSSSWFKTYPLRNGITITWKPSDQEDLDIFNPFRTANSLFSTAPIHPFLWIQIYGAAINTSVAQVECIWRYEGQNAALNFGVGGDFAKAPTPAQVGWFEKAQNVLSAVDPIIPSIGTFSNAAAQFAQATVSNYVRTNLMNGSPLRSIGG
jgi:hypothetical protein